MRLDDLYLVDIIEAGESLAEFLDTDDATEAEFAADEMLAAAVHMKLLIIGEALSSMKEETRDRFVGVPVHQIRGLRNRLVHGYFTIDEGRVYAIATRHVPSLCAEAERVLEELFPETLKRLNERRAAGEHD